MKVLNESGALVEMGNDYQITAPMMISRMNRTISSAKPPPAPYPYPPPHPHP